MSAASQEHRKIVERPSEDARRPFPDLPPPIFVVQKHHASRLHYDFRLEIGGVLVSWAIPKGPSLSPRERRLAIQTEDHPLGYATFEGKIPPGNYGAGTVIVWDYGRWEMLSPDQDPMRALRAGTLKFVLYGRKLHGRWALVRLKGRTEKEWLLIKERDEEAREAPAITEAEPRSALSGRTLEEVERDPNAPVLSCHDFG
ncbi:MAG: DNA polymerase ligase N-terminal domain-containing protein [Acidobacteriota bacterium]|nr:DNA polymerase ligase N-terminal domain-containing protein [Acidobacteriota bacterium]MDW8256819.1 DNA polymerase ligase N-terminal domain-containing protein [Acidobacteriota bacterium]